MIQFDIGFKVDSKSLEGQLNTIHKEIQNAFKVDAGFSGGMSKEISNAVVQARSLEKALQAATTDKGLSFSSMNAELRKAGTNMNQVVSGLIAGGDAFKGSANEALAAFANANRQVIALNSHLQEMGRVFLQSMKFTIAQQAIQGLQNMLQESYEWVVDLDSQLTQIQIVSGKTAQEMEAVSAQIVERSRALKVAAQDYAEASQIYYQQGLQDAEVQRRADITIKAANAANENVKAMSDMLTAVWNTYNMTGDQLENAASVGAKLGAETAIEFRDIAEAMQISATAASQMGVSYNSLASIIATVGSTTRQSASVIGNAYKTIFNNFQRLKVDGENGEVTLKAASQQLQALGINLLDASGQVKELDEVIMQAGQNWKNYSENEQLAIAQLVGGTRQFGQFLALMNNFDYYLQNLNSANMETGAETLEEQYSIAMESIEAKAENAAEAWQRAFSNFYDTDGIKDLIDLIADLGNMTNDAIEAFGGLDGVIQVIAAVGMTQLPKMFTRMQASAIDFWDSLTPGNRAKRIERDVNQMFSFQSNKLSRSISKEATNIKRGTGDATYLAQLKNENSLLKVKKQVTLDAAKAQDQLNKVISSGSPIQKNIAEGIKEEISVRQQNILTILDEAEALSKRNTELQAEMSRALSVPKTSVSNGLISYNGLQLTPQEMFSKTPVDQYTPDQEALKAQLNTRSANLQQIAASSGFGQIQADLIKLDQQVEKNEISLARYLKNIDKYSKQLSNSIKSIGTDATKLVQLMQKAATGSKKLNANELKELEQVLSNLKNNGVIGLDAIIQKIQELQNTGKSGAKKIQDDVFGLLGNAADEAATHIDKVAASMDKIEGKSVEALAGNIRTQIQNVRSQRGLITDLENSIGKIPGQGKDNKTKISFNQMLTGVTSLVGGFEMATISANMFFNALEEGNLNIITVVSSLSMLVSSVGMFSTGIQAIPGLSKAAAGAGKAATAAFTSLGNALGVAGSGTAALAAGAAAVIIPLTAIVALLAYAYTENKNNSLDARISRATEAVEALKSATADAQQEAENLKSTIESYTSTQQILQDCTKGTEEWKNALSDANDQALQILDTLSGLDDINLSDLYERGPDGEIIFDEKALQRAQQETSLQANTLEYASYLAQGQVTDLRAQQDYQQLGNKIGYYSAEYREQFDNATGDAEHEAALDTLEKEKDRITDWLIENAEALNYMSDSEIKDALKELGINVDLLGENFTDYAKEIKEVAQKQANQNEQTSLYLQGAAREILGDSYDQDSISVISNIQNEAAKKIEEELLGDGGLFDKFNKVDWLSTGNQEALVQRIRDAFNDQSIEAADNFVRGMDSDRSFAIEINGEEKVIRAEELASIIAASEALRDLQINAADVSHMMAELSNRGDEGALKSFLGTGNLEGVNKGDFQDLQEEVNDADSAEDYLRDKGDELGLKGEDLDNFVKAYADSLEDALDVEWEDLEEELKENFGEDFDAENITLGVAETLNNTFEDIKFDKGKKAAKEWGEQFSEMRDLALQGIEDDDQYEAIDNILASITGESSLAEIINQLEAQGITVTDEMTNKINNLIESASSGIPVFEEAAESFTGLVNVFKSLEENRQIEEDTYKEYLSQYGLDIMSEFFTPLGDGTYLLTKSAEEFYNEIAKSYQDQMNQDISNKGNQIEAIDYLQTAGIDLEGIRDVTQLFSAIGKGQISYEEINPNAKQAMNNAGQPIADIITAYGMQDQISADTFSNLSNKERLDPQGYREVSEVLTQILNKDISLREQEAALTKEKQQQVEQLKLMQIMQDAELSGISSTEVLDLADTYQELAGSVNGYNEILKEDEALVAEVAKEQLRFNQGLEDGYDKMEDWNKALESGDIASYSKALEEMSEVYGNILDIDGSELSDSFKTDAENLDLLNTIMNGTEEEAAAAYDELSALAALDIFEQNEIEDIGLDQIQSIQDALSGLNVGDKIDLEGPIKAQLDSIVNACRGDVDLINSIFSLLNIEPITKDDIMAGPPLGATDLVEGGSIGVSEEVDTKNIQATANMEMTGMSAVAEEPFTAPIEVIGDGITNGGQIGTVSFPQYSVQKTAPETAEQKSEIPAQSYTLRAEAGGEGGLQVTNSGRQKVGSGTNPSGSGRNPSGGGKGGGGGKKSTYKKSTPKVRYTNRENQISRTQQTTEKLAQVEDQLYGRAKLAAMQKKSDLIVQQVKDYKALYDEAVAYREQDMQDLAATQLGQAVPMQIDAEGNILNQEEMDDYMREWKDRIDAIEDEGAKEAEQRAYDISEQAYTYYKEAQEKALEAMKNAVDQLGEWISNEIEKRQYQMEIDIKVSDRQLSLLEFTLEELGSAGWITNWEDGLDNVIDQVDSIMSAGESTIDSTYQLIDLFDKVNNGGLDWTQLDQDMKDMFPQEVWEQANANGTLTNDILEAIGDNTETLLDYAGQLTEAWVSAWEKIGEAMDSYLEQMERARSPLETQAEVLETFISVADQVGWDVDKIDKYNELLDKQTDILEANYEASVKQAEATKDALDAMEPVYQDYLERFENGEITGQQFDVIQEQYYNLVDANQEAISQMTSDWSAYVENLQEKFEIAQQQIIKTWNDGIGNMWNDLAESQEGFDLFESLRTWYLDGFNKDYGLTTLTNQIEDAMNSISDPSRLKEYDAFMAEIVAKQEEGYELSQGELDVLNARFQLMQAQDAYEEAKNNKNTMRLTRDASGNYSYVYSSDSTENQEQAVLDAQKALHDAEEQYLSESESRWYEWMLKKYDLVVNTDWELYAHDEEYRRQFQLQWDQLTQAMQNATNDVNNALTYTDRTYEETAIHHMTNTESMNQANAQYNEQFQILWDEIQAKYKETDQKVQESASLIIDSNLSLEDAANDLMGTIDDTMGNMMDTTDELADNMSSNMQTMIEDTASWSDSIIEEINAVIAKYKELYEAQTSVMQNHTGETKNYEWHMDGNTGQWYYGDNNGGYYKSGWMEIDGKWYFFDDAGYLDMGTDRGDGTFWVDNGHYQVDKDGAWVEGTIAEGHTPGDWVSGSDTKNWGANYSDLASGNWSNTNSGGQLSSNSNQNNSYYIPEEADPRLPFESVTNGHYIPIYSNGIQFNPETDTIKGVVKEEYADYYHDIGWNQEPDGSWWYANGLNAGEYLRGWYSINNKLYHFRESDGIMDYEGEFVAYAKGGYTGNKGLRGIDTIPSMLAPGEYVLNADDTTKILSAVQLLRGLSSGALTAAANAIAKLANGSIPQTAQSEQIPVQQDVHIEATFPNVSVASEIEDALNNLVNETVQLIGSQNSRRL